MSIVQPALVIGGLAVGSEEVVLGRLGRTGGEVAFAVLDEPCETKLRGSLHQRVSALCGENRYRR